MEATSPREYAIELFVDERWQELYRSAERADAESVWQRVLETQPRSEARLVEVDVLRTFAGDTAARSPFGSE